MREMLGVLALTVGAAVWLWAWQRFVPRPPERTIEERFEYRPSPTLAFFGLVLFMFAPMFLILPFAPAKHAENAPPDEVMRAKMERYRLGFIAHLASIPIVVGGILAAARAQRQPWWTFGVRIGGLRSAAVEGVRVWWEWLPLVMCVNGLVRLLAGKRPEETNPVELILRGEGPPSLIWLAAAAAVLRAPLVEELVFRGLFQTWFNVFTAWPAILSASILFAAIHPTFPDQVPLILVGVMLGLAYQRTRNLLAPIVAHSLFNGFMTVVALTVRE
jgi:membrane protease YdiL (CAAX protease family)